MQTKLAALFTLVALVVFLLTWILRLLIGMSHWTPERALLIVLVAGLGYYLYGKAVAWVGIRLVQEQLSEKRAKEEELHHELAMLESRARRGGTAEAAGESADDVGAPEEAGGAVAGGASTDETS